MGTLIELYHKDREAAATGRVTMNKETLQKIVNMSIKKGNVFEVARIAAIMAVKQTSYIVSAATETPVNASISTPVLSSSPTVTSIST